MNVYDMLTYSFNILFAYIMQRSRDETPDVKLSKFISYICRHGAEKEGIEIQPG